MNQDDKVLKAIQDYFDSSSEAKENLSRMFNELKDKSDDDEKSDNEDATEEDEKQKKANNEDDKNSKSDNEDKKEDKDDDEKTDNEDASAEDDKEDEEDDKKASSKTENSYEKIIQKISNSFEQKEKDKLKAYNAVSPILGDFNAFGLSEREILVKGLSSAGVKVSNEKVPELYAMLKVLNSVKIDNSFEYKNQSSSLETVDFNF